MSLFQILASHPSTPRSSSRKFEMSMLRLMRMRMTEKQWYQLYLEDYCTMEGHADQRCFISTRTELASPTTDWERTWRLARLKGLGPDNTTFLFRLGHKLLVTKERQSRTNPASSPICTALGCGAGCVENLEHALIQCQANNGVCMALMLTLRQTIPTLTSVAALRLGLNVSAKEELPLVWVQLYFQFGNRGKQVRKFNLI